MAKITRATFLQFAVNVNAAADICAFGTPATGSPVYTTNIATLQGQTAYTTGWAAETISSNRPFLEDMNAICYVFAYMLAYIFEMGIPEYDASTTYYTNSVVQYLGIIYQSLVDTNLGNTPVVGANWKTLKTSAQFGAWNPYSSGTTPWAITTPYQAATDGQVTFTGFLTASAFQVDGKTDASSSPSTTRVSNYSVTSQPTSITFPVRKGDYWQINTSFAPTTYTIFFLPSGN